MAVKTYGLTHIALVVRDARRSSQFYKDVLGAVEVYNQDGFVQLQTPGTARRDRARRKERRGGVAGRHERRHRALRLPTDRSCRYRRRGARGHARRRAILNQGNSCRVSHSSREIRTATRSRSGRAAYQSRSASSRGGPGAGPRGRRGRGEDRVVDRHVDLDRLRVDDDRLHRPGARALFLNVGRNFTPPASL